MPASGKSGNGASPSQKSNRGPSAGPANRRALIAAAREVFGADGFAAPFNAVAKRAGVGQGSLYRHFPDRVALAAAVFDENVDELEVVIARPGSTIDDLLDAVIEQALVSTAFIDMITANPHDARVAPLGLRLRRIAETVLENARSSGSVGTHVEADDLLLAVSMLAEVLARSDAADRAGLAHRARALFHAAFAPRG